MKDRNYNHDRRPRILPAGALATLLAVLVGLVATTQALGSGSAGGQTPELGSLDQQVEYLREARERLDADGEIGTGPPAPHQKGAAAAPGAGAFLLQGVLRGLGTVGTDAGIQGILAALGKDTTKTMLDDVTTSLDELHTKVEAMATRMEQLFSETQFKDTHRDLRTAYDVVDGHARSIAGFEKSGTDPSDLQLNNIAKDSYTAVSTMRGLLTDSKTGAIPLILASYGKDAPVSTGTEPWERVDTYRGHFLAAQALAVTNLAWVADRDASYESSHLDPAADMLRTTHETAYEITGAPHPRDPHGGSILHRIGEDWALMTKGRPRLVGEKGAAKPAIDRSEMEPKLERLASGYTPIDGASLEDYMAEAGFKTSSRFHDTYGWDILVNGSGHTSTMVAWSHTGSISGNAYDYRKNEYFRQESKARRDLMENHLKDMTAKNKANLAENPRFFAAPIHTNALGWPALTDAESVRVSRDGLEGLEIERQAGSRVEATFDNPDHRYKHFRITDAHTGKSLHTSGLPSRGGWPWTPEFETDAIVVEVGYDVSGEFEPRGGSVVTSNPGESSVNLKLWMNTP